jgi:hypothetical protein
MEHKVSNSESKHALARTSRRRRAPLLVSGIFLLFGGPAIDAQAATGPGCTQNGCVYTCSRFAFQTALREAQSVSIETQPRDRTARSQLREFLKSLGKTVQPAEQPTDLTFVLIPPDFDGVIIGPADRELGNLRIYGPTVDGQRGSLIWAETFRGQPDMPWPSVVHALISQFQSEFAKR